MAGMRPFVLSEETGSVDCDSLAAPGCPSSQIAIAQPTAVPLWKVIVGPRADELYRTRKGPVFLFARPEPSGLLARERQAHVRSPVIGRYGAPAFPKGARRVLACRGSPIYSIGAFSPVGVQTGGASRERSNGL